MSVSGCSFSHMTNTARRREAAPRKKPGDQRGEDAVFVIPEWVSEWGWLLLAPAGLVLVLISYVIGVRDGSASGWTLFLAIAAAATTVGCWDYLRRLRKCRAQREQRFYEQSEFSKLDAMTWKQLEHYCGDLLTALHYKNVSVIGSRPDEGGLDILATDPDDMPVGVQVKHKRPNADTGKLAPIEAGVVRELQGAVKSVQYANYRGILMSNTYVQPGGRAYARENGLTILDRREGLGDWMSHARNNLSSEAVNGTRGHLRPETRLTLGIVCCAVIAVLVVVINALVNSPRQAIAAAPPAARTTPPAATSASPSPPPTPEQVVREFYTAISSRDWPEVWQLGGRNLGEGSYATYSGMVSGYKNTIRDALTEVHASGNTVTGRFLAFQTGNAIRPYQFTYVVHDGVIVSGHQQEEAG
jgi:Restriction endonuclease